MTEVDLFVLPDNDDEEGWITWAHIALKYEGVNEALEVLAAYLGLNPDRAEELERDWNDARARDWQQGLAEPDDDQAGTDREDIHRAP